MLNPFRGCGPPTGTALGRYRHIILRDRSGKGRQAQGRLNPARRQAARHGRGLPASGPQLHQLQGMDRKFLVGPRPNGKRITARGNPPDGDTHAPVVAQVRGGAARSRHRGTSNGSSTVSVRWPAYSFRSSAARTVPPVPLRRSAGTFMIGVDAHPRLCSSGPSGNILPTMRPTLIDGGCPIGQPRRPARGPRPRCSKATCPADGPARPGPLQ